MRAKIKKIVVGMPGTNTPIIAKPTQIPIRVNKIYLL